MVKINFKGGKRKEKMKYLVVYEENIFVEKLIYLCSEEVPYLLPTRLLGVVGHSFPR